MKSKHLLTLLTTILVFSTANATQVTFRAEIDSIIVGSTPVDRDNIGSLGVVASGGFVSAANFNAFITNDVWTGTQGSTITLEQAGAILDFFQTTPLLNEVQVVSPVSGAPAGAGVLSTNGNAGAAGFHPVFLIGTGSGFSAGDYLGIVTSTFATLAAGTTPITFSSTTNTWDTFLVGQSGSLALSQVVPEPSTYAAILGLLALGFVAYRRRRLA
jgi:hypothetical protein